MAQLYNRKLPELTRMYRSCVTHCSFSASHAAFGNLSVLLNGRRREENTVQNTV